MVRGGCKNGDSKDLCSKGLGVRTQNLLIILGSIVSTIEGTYVII